MTPKKKILFLCTHNAARSQMAEGLINARHADRYEAQSAGNEPTEVHACAIKVMADLGIDISSHRAKSLDEFDDLTFDYVVTLCADVQESCPIFPAGRSISITPLTIPCQMPGKAHRVHLLGACVTNSGSGLSQRLTETNLRTHVITV